MSESSAPHDSAAPGAPASPTNELANPTGKPTAPASNSTAPPVGSAPNLPDGWLRQFDGERLNEKSTEASILSTVDAEGWGHVAFLSAGEVLAPERSRVYLAIWPHSRTVANLRQRGQATLLAVVDDAVWEARLSVRAAQGAPVAGSVQIFAGRVMAVRRHPVPYAQVDHLVGYRLRDQTAVLERWSDQVALLRRAAQSPESD